MSRGVAANKVKHSTGDGKLISHVKARLFDSIETTLCHDLSIVTQYTFTYFLFFSFLHRMTDTVMSLLGSLSTAASPVMQ
jgi:hypothetical protein